MSKKSFKIVLDSDDTTSFIGSEYNANYYIDLTKVIRDKDDYDKKYYVYCTFISASDATATSNISSTLLYTLTLNISNKSNNIYQNTNNNLFSFILPVQVNTSDNGAGGPHLGFLLQDKDQRPLFLDNLHNINNINVKVLQNGATCMATEYYVCILTFVEI